MSFKLPEFGNTGAFDTFNVPDAGVEEAPFLSESQKNERQKHHESRIRARRMGSPDTEIAKIMGTIPRVDSSPVPERPRSSRSALSELMKTPEAKKITEQQLLKNELDASLQEEIDEQRSSRSSNSRNSNNSSSPEVIPTTCEWCGKALYSSREKERGLHKDCEVTYQISFDFYNPHFRNTKHRNLTMKETRKMFDKDKEREKKKDKRKKELIKRNKKMFDLIAQGKGNDITRDTLFPQKNPNTAISPNPQFSGIPDSPEIPDSPDIYQNIDVQTGDHSALLDSDNEEPNDAQSNVEEAGKYDPLRYSTKRSKLAREIRAREALEARREKHKKMIAQNKTKCKKKDKKGRCVISGGKKRRKTKKRRRKKRKTHRKRKSKKSKKRRRTRRK